MDCKSDKKTKKDKEGESRGNDSEHGQSDEGTIYDLFAIANHYGRLGFGHYTSFARDWAGMYTAHRCEKNSTSDSKSERNGDIDLDEKSSRQNKNDSDSEKKYNAERSGKYRETKDGRSYRQESKYSDVEVERAGYKDGDDEEGGEKEVEREGQESVWYSYDDNDVTRIETKDIKTRAAYILFYRKRPPNCVPSGTQ